MGEWEARLNGDDIPIKGQYGRMALDIVPLPVIPFVSTNRMSAFAARWGFHVFPNLRGRTDRIAARLLSASIGLAEMVKDWMISNRIEFLCN